jgi:hypothetical protein
MAHLTVDEMIQFVSLTELNSEAMELSASVNGHIRSCGECLRQVRAFQMIYDEFTGFYQNGDFKKYLTNKAVHSGAEPVAQHRLTLEPEK